MDANTTMNEGIEINCEKYHPSILQNTAHKHLSGIIDRIDPQKKYAFLDILQNSFKNILSCFKCKSLLKNNSSAFNCGHKYCEQCSINLENCVSCKDNGKIRTTIRNFSNILDVINELKLDFNSDRIIFEVIRFLLFGSESLETEEEMEEASIAVNNNTPPVTSQSKDDSLKKSRKLASKIKKQKTPLHKGENFRKKLKFDKTESSPQISVANCLENDSENLFIETAKTRKSSGRKSVSYLEMQPALLEINADASSTSKRKRETSDENVKRAKKKCDPEASPVKVDTGKRRVSVRLNKVDVEAKSSSPDLQNQGTFCGFAENEIGESDQKLTKWRKRLGAKRSNLVSKNNGNANNSEISIGESKQTYLRPQGKKTNSILEALKSTVGEMRNDVKIENTLATVRNVDTEELDLNVWKANDKNDKRKRLFKSVKERNKRDVSISGTLDNLLDRQKLTTENNIRPKVNLQESISDETNDPKNRSCNNQTNFKEHFANDDAPTKTDEISNKNHSQINEVQKDVSPTPPKKIIQKDIEIVQNLPFNETTNEVTFVPPVEKEAILSPKETLINNVEESKSTVDPIATENISKKILANGSPKLAEVAELTKSKLGLPLFPDTQDPDIFSQMGAVCSSTPCGPAKLKVTKTYSRAKNKLFDRTISDISPIIERHTEYTDDPKYEPETSPASNKLREIRSHSPSVSNLAHDSPKTPSNGVNGQTGVDKTPIPAIKNVESPIKIIADCETPRVENKTAKPSISERTDDNEVPSHTPVLPSPSKVQDVEPDLIETPLIPVSNLNLIDNENDKITPMEVDYDTDEIAKAVDKFANDIISRNTPKKAAVEEPSPIKDSSDVEQMKRNKVKKLQQNINNKNEKLLSSLKKNFNLISPKLSIEKVKNPITSGSLPSKSPNPKTSALSESLVIGQNEEKNMISVEKKTPDKEKTMIASKTKTPENLSPKIVVYDDTIPTQKYSTPRKDVACQTCPDLIDALLKEKFPQLFEKYDSKSDYPLSVYDTPIEQNNQGPALASKTPETRAVDTSAKYTLISAITSSEKKFADKHFMNDSVLCDSPFTVGSANKTTNVSGYAPLTPEHRTEEKKKLSCRLNFVSGADQVGTAYEGDEAVGDVSRDRVKSPGDESENRNVDEVSCQRDEVQEQPVDEVLANGSYLDDILVDDVPERNDKSVDDGDRSNEIVFNDSINDKIQELCERVEHEEIESASILENTKLADVEASHQVDVGDEDKTFFESDSVAVIPDTEPTIYNDNLPKIPVRATESDVNENVDDEKVISDDDDDIDFVAGTPTSQPRVIIGSSLEKNKTPRRLFDRIKIPLDAFSVCENTTPKAAFVEPLPDTSQYSVVKKVNPVAEVTPTREPQIIEDADKSSVELLNSEVSNSTFFHPIYVSTSGLKEPDVKMITKFCEKFGATYLDKLTDASTHLIVKTDQKNKTARTFKFLQAIVNGVRIVSMHWIHECIAKNRIISEENFIPLDSSGECGPLRTFNVIKGVTPSPLSWLNDYCIYFTEPVPQECTLEQLQGIMRKAGAIIVDSLREFKKYPNHHHIIIVSEDDDDEDDDKISIKVAGWLQTYQAISVEFNWMLEVIGRNKVVPFGDYEVVEIPNEYLLRMNFPAEMLESDEEPHSSD